MSSPSSRALVLLLVGITAFAAPASVKDGDIQCRYLPGDPNFPSVDEWRAFNESIGGRLMVVEPSAKVCQALGCSEDQWSSTRFRASVPGAMVNVSFSSFRI